MSDHNSKTLLIYGGSQNESGVSSKRVLNFDKKGQATNKVQSSSKTSYLDQAVKAANLFQDKHNLLSFANSKSPDQTVRSPPIQEIIESDQMDMETVIHGTPAREANTKNQASSPLRTNNTGSNLITSNDNVESQETVGITDYELYKRYLQQQQN